MASKVSNATISVRQSEDVSLLGEKYGGANSRSISGCNEVQKRIITCTNGGTKVAAFGSGTGTGQFDKGSFLYGRITNLDTSEVAWVILGDTGGTNDLIIKLEAGQTYVLNNLYYFVSDSANVTDYAGSGVMDIDQIHIAAHSSADGVDCEILIATS